MNFSSYFLFKFLLFTFFFSSPSSSSPPFLSFSPSVMFSSSHFFTLYQNSPLLSTSSSPFLSFSPLSLSQSPAQNPPHLYLFTIQLPFFPLQSLLPLIFPSLFLLIILLSLLSHLLSFSSVLFSLSYLHSLALFIPLLSLPLSSPLFPSRSQSHTRFLSARWRHIFLLFRLGREKNIKACKK